MKGRGNPLLRAKRGNLILGATHWDCFTAFAMTGFLEIATACSERSEGISFAPRDDTLKIAFLILTSFQ